MGDVSRFFRRSSPSPTRGPYETPSLVIDTEGYVFLRGSSNIGVGTRGIGERAATAPGEGSASSSGSPNRSGAADVSYGSAGSPNTSASAQRRKDAQIRGYIKDRTELHKQWRDKAEALRNAKLAEQQNARMHMHMVMQKHRQMVSQMGQELKAEEQRNKEKLASDAAARNSEIRAANEKFLAEQKAAKEEREAQKKYEAEALRKKRVELAEIDAAERAAADAEAKGRIVRLQEAAKIERVRMEKAKREHDREVHALTDSMRKRQGEREAEHAALVQDIVKLKSELITNVKQEETTLPKLVQYQRQVKLTKEATEVRNKLKEEDVEIKAKREQRKAEARTAAEERAREAKEHFEQFMESRDKAKSLLQLQAREQKQRARTAIAEEERARYESTQAYIKSCRSLVARRVTMDMIKDDDSKHFKNNEYMRKKREAAERESQERKPKEDEKDPRLRPLY